MYGNEARQPEIVSSAYGDVNGDGHPDHVFLTAIPSAEPGSPYLEQITLHIQPHGSNQVFAIALDENANSGYHPTIFLGDFTKDGIADILIRINSGGSGAFTYNYVFSFVNNQAWKLFDSNRYNEYQRYQVTYLDGYRVEVKSLATSDTFFIDISGRATDYLSPLYDEHGKLKKPIQGDVNGVSGFYPVDMDQDGVYELQAYQRIAGLYNADALGYVINTLQWNGQSFAIWQQWVAIFANAR